jgi:SAM-dependent methyltransferase
LATALVKDEPTITEAFKTGSGVGWHEHNHDLFSGTERFFRPGYAANLIPSWIPALDGVQAKLESGARVADVGCGHGASTIIMAQAFPRSEFVGFDYHAASIEQARKTASEAGLDGRVGFDISAAKEYPGDGYDLVTMFDCLHDMGDSVGASAHVLETLEADGTWMIVEPYAGDRLEDNLNPVGRVFYGASTRVHPRVTRSGGGARARRPGRRGAAGRGRFRGQRARGGSTGQSGLWQETSGQGAESRVRARPSRRRPAART